MNAITYDTHHAIKRLKKQGFDEKQAEAVVEEIRNANISNSEIYTTKSDILGLASKADLFEAKYELLKWMFTGFVAVIGLLVAVLMKLN
jgi:hypothetical protein